MADYSVDAIKIAKAIQKDELSILRGKEFKMRDKIKKKRRMKKTKKKKNKYTLNQLGNKVNQLGTTVDKLAATIDQIGDAVMQLTNSFASFKKEVNERFDRIEGRLDYIVKANNLKDNK